MKLLVDTNVFLDFFLRRQDKYEEALNFFIWCKKYKNQIYVTSMSLRDIGYVAHRYLHDEQKAKYVQLKTYQIVSKVIGISADSAITGLYTNGIDYEDFLQINAAEENMLDGIVTNNIKDFSKVSTIPCFTPKYISSFDL